jgi:hypothetical protein
LAQLTAEAARLMAEAQRTIKQQQEKYMSQMTQQQEEHALQIRMLEKTRGEEAGELHARCERLQNEVAKLREKQQSQPSPFGGFFGGIKGKGRAEASSSRAGGAERAGSSRAGAAEGPGTSRSAGADIHKASGRSEALPAYGDHGFDEGNVEKKDAADEKKAMEYA